MNIFELRPHDEAPALRYVGTGLAHQLLMGPGRPDEGHIQLVPQVRYEPTPSPEGVVLILVRGPLFGVSQSGLTVYGGADRVHLSAIHVGAGWLLRVRNPQVVSWARPTGRSDEAHCAEPQWVPAAALAHWADATRGVALCGESQPIERADLGEQIGEPIWLATRRERMRRSMEHPLFAYVYQLAGGRGDGGHIRLPPHTPRELPREVYIASRWGWLPAIPEGISVEPPPTDEHGGRNLERALEAFAKEGSSRERAAQALSRILGDRRWTDPEVRRDWDDE